MVRHRRRPESDHARSGILEPLRPRRDVLLGAGATGLMISTTVLPTAVAAASVGPVSYSAEPTAKVTSTDIVAGGNAYRLLRIELATLENGTATQVLQFSEAVTIDILLVGGGGGGGMPSAEDGLPSAGGGGGAGEVFQFSGYNAPAGTYSVRVGGAGAAVAAGGAGESGAPSVFASGLFDGASVDLAVAGGGLGGGGGGAAAGSSATTPSGSGGGGGGGETEGAVGGDVSDIGGRRNDGGAGAVGLGGGGGGAGTAGGQAGQSTGGAGGGATDLSEFLGSAVGTAFVAGGGGGGGPTGGAAGDGGGVGASGSDPSDATVGTNGTGGGGGGGYLDATGLRQGSRGGTGVAFIRIHL